jgi:hypothetical protein
VPAPGLNPPEDLPAARDDDSADPGAARRVSDDAAVSGRTRRSS